MDGDNKIKVFCRVRGGPTPRKAVTSVSGTESIAVGTHSFAFNWVGDRSTTQEEVFAAVGAPLTDVFLSGFNCCIFTYGQVCIYVFLSVHVAS